MSEKIIEKALLAYASNKELIDRRNAALAKVKAGDNGARKELRQLNAVIKNNEE